MKTEYRKFLEDKNRLISRLQLSDDQKHKLKMFFKIHPNWENKIDWNNKNLKWEDFQDVLALEGTSKNSKKKYGLSGKAKIEDLVLNKDYKVIFENDHCVIYYPLTFKASEVLAKPTTPPVGVQGMWCIAGRNYSPGTRDQHWNNYLDQGIDFFFIFTKDKYLINPATAIEREEELEFMLDILQDATNSYHITKFGLKLNSKYALARRPSGTWQIFNSKDSCIFSKNPAELLDQFPAFKEIAEAIEAQPNEVLASRYWTDPRTGCVYSNDKQKLCKVPLTLANGAPVPKTLYIPEGVRSIGEKVFYNTDYFEKVYIPDSVTYISKKAFFEAKIGTLYIGAGVASIDDDAFLNFQGNIVFTGNRIEIPSNIFEEASLSDVYMPDSVLSIGYQAFCDNETLKTVEFSKNLKVIGAGAFANNKLLAFNLPDSVEEIQVGAFRSNLFINVSLPPKLKQLSDRAFSGCANLKSVTINDGCTSIGRYAFKGCSRLKSITIPASVTDIGNGAFVGCPLLRIYYTGTKEQWEDLLRNNDPHSSHLEDALYMGPGWENPEEKVAFI